MACPGSVHDPAPVNVLQMPFIACTNEADRRHIALPAVIVLEPSAPLAIEVLPTDQPAPPDRASTQRVGFDLLADEPCREDRRGDSTRHAVS